MKHHCPKCGWETDLEFTHCSDCGASFIAANAYAGEGTESNLVPRPKAAWLFISIFFLPLLVVAFIAMLNGYGKGFASAIGWLPYYIACYTAWFPSGLIAAICGASWSYREFGWVWGYSAMGYLIYGFVFCAMLSFRRRWQVTCLAVFLISLVALNSAGCQKVADASMRGWSP